MYRLELAPVAISIVKDLFSLGFIQSSAAGWSRNVREQIGHEILNGRELSKKGSVAAHLGLRHADCEQGDRSLPPAERALAMETHNEGLSASRSESLSIEEVLRHLVESTLF